jgi:hypothetical protein
MMAAIHSTSEIVIQVLMIASFVIAAIVAIIRQGYAKRAERHRLLDLQSLAMRLEFDDFNPNHDEGFAQGWGFLSRLDRGNDRYAFNILRGKYHDQTLFVFDYHYQTGSGKNREEHYSTLLMLVSKAVFPQMSIGPASLRSKIAEAFGIANDIKFESAEFSRTFCVRSPDKKFAYDVCNPQMIEYLLTNPGLQVEIQGPVILLAFEPQLPVGQIEFNLQRLIEIRSRLPEYLFTNT